MYTLTTGKNNYTTNMIDVELNSIMRCRHLPELSPWHNAGHSRELHLFTSRKRKHSAADQQRNPNGSHSQKQDETNGLHFFTRTRTTDVWIAPAYRMRGSAGTSPILTAQSNIGQADRTSVCGRDQQYYHRSPTAGCLTLFPDIYKLYLVYATDPTFGDPTVSIY